MVHEHILKLELQIKLFYIFIRFKGCWVMFMDDRKRRILQAIIDSHIDTAEPVGSRTIAKKHQLGLSSATIRNVMADLEDMGYLTQPYTSAGRIPSDKGYRFYVDQLMITRELTEQEIESIKSAMEVKINELSQLIKRTSEVISHFTKYTSMAVTPQMKKSSLKAVQVVPIDSFKLLVIVVTKEGIVRNSLVKIQESILPDHLIRVSNTLNEKLSGLAIDQINREVINDIQKEIMVSKDVLIPILNGVFEGVKQVDNSEIYLEGTTNILNFPEFRDVAKAKEFLEVLDEKELLFNLLRSSAQNGSIKIKIGEENNIEEIKDCSLLTTTYGLGNKVVGTIGIIGPTRMNYSKVISSINYIRNKINEQIKQLFGGNPDEG
jgi:heat-inducible transcriptional repressor